MVFFQLNVSFNARLFNDLRALTNLRNIFTAFAVVLIELLEAECQNCYKVVPHYWRLVEKKRRKSEFPGKNCTRHPIYTWACVNKGFFHCDSIVVNKQQACTLCYKCLLLMLAAEQLAEVDVSEGAAKKKQTRGDFNS